MAPMLDSSARQALVEQAAGKSTRQVEKLLAGVDPELTAPADRIRPLGAGRWELKAVIDDDCRSGLEQLKGLLSHVDPHLTLGQLVGRVVREAVERHDPSAARPAHRHPGRCGRRRNFGAEGREPGQAPRRHNGPPFRPAPRLRRRRRTLRHRRDADCEHARATAAKRAGAMTRPSASKDAIGPDGATAAPAGAPSPAKASADCRRGRAVPAKRSEAAVRSATSAPKAECARQAAPPASQALVRGRAIPAAVKRRSGSATGVLQLRGPRQRVPLRLPASAADRSHRSVRARRQRRAGQSAAVVRRPSPPPPRRPRKDGPRCRPPVPHEAGRPSLSFDPSGD